LSARDKVNLLEMSIREPHEPVAHAAAAAGPATGVLGLADAPSAAGASLEDKKKLIADG